MLKVRIARVSSTYTSKSGLQSSHSAASTYPKQVAYGLHQDPLDNSHSYGRPPSTGLNRQSAGAPSGRRTHPLLAPVGCATNVTRTKVKLVPMTRSRIRRNQLPKEELAGGSVGQLQWHCQTSPTEFSGPTRLP